MSRDALKTLFHPFAFGLINPPDSQSRILFLGAEPGFVPPDGFPQAIECVQGFRPAFLALGRAGRNVTPQPEGTGFDLVLVLCGRHRGENEIRIAEALERTRPDGTIVIAGVKEDGMASVARRLGSLVPLEGQIPKHHGIVAWFRRPDSVTEAVAALRKGAAPSVVDGRFHTSPGMFSHDRVDAGSKLLADSLPGDLKGLAADFCAGWGYLASRLLAGHPRLTGVDLYEADHASLEAARRNLAPITGGKPCGFLWHDLLSEPVPRKYDVLMMNPPFHTGRAAEPHLGQGMIKAAAGALKSGGRLFMVANRQLPYEAELRSSFAVSAEIARHDGFKVFTARR